MSDKKVSNRWSIVVGALLVQLCLGAIYAWGAFTSGLENSKAEVAFSLNPKLLGVSDENLAKYNDEAFRAEVMALQNELSALKAGKHAADGAAVDEQIASLKKQIDEKLAGVLDLSRLNRQTFNLSSTQRNAIFSVVLAVFAIVMIKAGRIQDKIGPKKLAIIGGLVLSAGFILAGLMGTSFVALLIFLGIMGGAGIGMAYVCPIAACVKWFPDLKGFVTGLAVAGFGAAAFLFAKIAGAWGGLIDNYGISNTFLIFGVIFAVGITIGGSLLSNPPQGWKPANWNPDTAKGAATPKVKDLTQGQVIKTSQFWKIWFAFCFNAGCGLLVISNVIAYGKGEGISTAAAATALGLLALFNGLGRIIWGTLSQYLTARCAMILMSSLQAVMMVLLLWMGSPAWALIFAACWIGFNYGGAFALFPLLTLEKFGAKNLGANYGAVFTSYGVGAIVLPIMGGYFRDTTGSFAPSFIMAAVACGIAAILGLTLRPPKVETAAALAPAE